MTARSLEKLTAFDVEVQHRPGKSIGHADGLSRIPIVNQVTTSQSKEILDRPETMKIFEITHKIGKLFFFSNQTTHSHTAFHPTSKCPQELPEVLRVSFPTIFQRAPILHFFLQQIDDRFIYISVMKKRFFQKPTYDSLRKSLEAMTNHAKNYKVTEISMRIAGYGLDRIERHKVERLIKQVCAQSKLTITVYDQNKTEQSQKQDETPVHSALGHAQRQGEALSKLIRWIEQGNVPTSQKLQGLHRLAWQFKNQLPDGILCRKFEIGDNEVVLQQILPPSMTHEILSACHSSSTADT